MVGRVGLVFRVVLFAEGEGVEQVFHRRLGALFGQGNAAEGVRRQVIAAEAHLTVGIQGGKSRFVHQDIVDVDGGLLRLRDDFKAIVRLGGEGEGTGGGVIVAPVVGAQAHLIHPRPQGQPLAALKAFRPNGEAELGRVADAGGAEGELVGISRVLVQGDAAEIDGVLGGIVDRDGVGRRIHLILLGIRRAEGETAQQVLRGSRADEKGRDAQHARGDQSRAGDGDAFAKHSL